MTLLKLSVDAANSLIPQLLHLREECAIFCDFRFFYDSRNFIRILHLC